MRRIKGWTVLVTRLGEALSPSRSAMAKHGRRSLAFAALLSACAMSAVAADYQWTNTLGGDFAGAGNWSPSGPPGAADNANFTNNATYPVTFSASPETANAYFDAPGGTVTQAVGAGNTWLLNTGYVVGRDAAASATVWHTSGTLAVTNTGGTAELKIGEAGKGYFSLTNSGSVVTADRLTLTNTASSISVLNGATLNTLRGSTVTNQRSVAGTWNMLGGTNTGGTLYPYGGGGKIVISGAGTVCTGNDVYVVIPTDTSGNRLIVTNGARVYGSNMDIGGAATGGNSGFDVAGTGSVLQLSGYMHHYRNVSTANIVDGGVFRVLADPGGGPESSMELGGYETMYLNVTGPGSVLTNAGLILMSWYGQYSTITVSAGGCVYTKYTYMSYLGAAGYGNDDLLRVTGSGSAYTNWTWFRIGGRRDRIQIENGGNMYVGGDLIIGFYGNSGWPTGQVVNVTGTGSVLRVAGTAYVGYDGMTGFQLSVSNGAAVYVTNAAGTAALVVGPVAAGEGLLTLTDGTITADRLYANNGALSKITFNSGALNVRTSNVTKGSALVIGNGSNSATLNLTGGLANWHVLADGLVITNNAILTGVGTIQAGVTNYGTINPGSSAGQMTITGSLNLASSSALNMEIGGYAQGTDYDYVLVQGPVTLGGALNVSLTNGFDLASATNGWTFTVVASTNLSGSFANVPNGAGVLRVGNRKLFVYYGAGSPYDPNQVVLSVQIVPRGTIIQGAWLKRGNYSEAVK